MLECNIGTLSPFTPSSSDPWDQKKVHHFYRRFGFGATNQEITDALTQNPTTFVENSIENTKNMPPTDAPVWANMYYGEYTDPDNQIPIQHEEWYREFVNDMLDNSFRGRLTLFWHNHFVTRLDDFWCPSWLYNYYHTLQVHSLGNFKEFVRAIGITPAMLIFLNGYENTSDEPNENYARELYELFTLGVDNGYTQTDIVNTARALTGYTYSVDYCAPFTFDSDNFDENDKTIFGQTGNWGYHDVIDILFEQRATEIATHICKKIYRYFVNPVVDDTIVSQLATTFIDNNFELAPVFKQLLKSEHFFNEFSIGTVVRSPYDYTNTFYRETGFTLTQEIKDNTVYFNFEVGQLIFDPVDVAGWQGNHDWINSSTLIGRWNSLQYYIWTIFDTTPEDLRTFAIDLCGTSTDPAFITQKIVDFLSSNGFQTQTDYDTATVIFKWEVPQNYYDNNLWNLQWDSAPLQVVVLLLHLIKQPELQLK